MYTGSGEFRIDDQKPLLPQLQSSWSIEFCIVTLCCLVRFKNCFEKLVSGWLVFLRTPILTSNLQINSVGRTRVSPFTAVFAN